MEIVAGVLIVLGLFGSFIPFLPGPVLSFAGLFIYAYASGFSEVGITPLLIFAVLTLLSLFVDVLAPVIGTKKYKSSRFGTAGSLIGTFVGILTIGPFGILVGPVVGSFLGELFFRKDVKSALLTAWGALIGFFAGVIFSFLVSLSTAIYFLCVLLF